MYGFNRLACDDIMLFNVVVSNTTRRVSKKIVPAS